MTEALSFLVKRKARKSDSPEPGRQRRWAPYRLSPKTPTVAPIDSKTACAHKETSAEVLRKALHGKGKIVVLNGAGISVNAGIPDFRSSTGMNRSSKDLFDVSVYNSNESTLSFHAMVCAMFKRSSEAKPTPFHLYLERLASSGRLVRQYTQNVDCIEESLPSLFGCQAPGGNSDKVSRCVQLHGRINRMSCQRCNDGSPFTPELFCGHEAPLCPKCSKEDTKRMSEGKRSRGIGRLRPQIVLYGEVNPNEDLIGMISGKDLKAPLDTAIVVGTTLKVPGMQRLVTGFCQAVKARARGTTVWIGREAPSSRFAHLFDFIVLGDCDEVVPYLE